MLLCLEAKGCVRRLVPSLLHRPGHWHGRESAGGAHAGTLEHEVGCGGLDAKGRASALQVEEGALLLEEAGVRYICTLFRKFGIATLGDSPTCGHSSLDWVQPPLLAGKNSCPRSCRRSSPSADHDPDHQINRFAS